jgi:branched-subunit amino acid aminotransferase/4-amino-4-deoxychorismate lyase
VSYWYQGELIDSPFLQIPYDDPALIYGASVFTTCRIYGEKIGHPLTMWSAHQQRLASDMQGLGWPAPHWENILAGVQKIAETYPVVRITLFSDGRELIWGRNLPADLDTKQQQGIAADIIAGFDRTLPQFKTGNYLAPWLAKQQAGQEAILVNGAGDWLETSTGNLWGWRNNTWYTPPLAAGILPGIIRAYLVQWLRTQGKIVNEDIWNQSLVNQLTGLAYSNAVMQFIPIHTVRTVTEQRAYPIDRPAQKYLRSAFSEENLEHLRKTGINFC